MEALDLALPGLQEVVPNHLGLQIVVLNRHRAQEVQDRLGDRVDLHVVQAQRAGVPAAERRTSLIIQKKGHGKIEANYT